MDNCQKESQRHGFCSKHLSQLREPNAFSQHMQRFVGQMSNLSHATALPMLADFYPRRFEYGNIPAATVAPAFFHSTIQIPSPLNALHSAALRSYSTPSPSSSNPNFLVNSNHSPSAFVPLLPIIRQHSVDITSPPSSSSSTPVLSNQTDSSVRRLSEDEDSDVDIETVPSTGE